MKTEAVKFFYNCFLFFQWKPAKFAGPCKPNTSFTNEIRWIRLVPWGGIGLAAMPFAEIERDFPKHFFFGENHEYSNPSN